LQNITQDILHNAWARC